MTDPLCSFLLLFASYFLMFSGFALQTQHTILGETTKAMYGKRQVPTVMNETSLLHGVISDTDPASWYFRYQLVGTWGGVFFPQHWREFLLWLREKEFMHAHGTSKRGFEPCVPSLVSNAWWKAKPHKVWSQWFVRFAFEKVNDIDTEEREREGEADE